MTMDMEDLLRDALTARSHDLTEAPRWDGPPANTSHRRPLVGAVVGIAATVAVVAGGAAWFAHRNAPGPQAGGNVPATCPANLPADWRDALAATAPSFHGQPVNPWVSLPENVLIGTVDESNGSTDVVRVVGDAPPTVLTDLPAGQIVTRVDADARWVAVSSAPRSPSSGPDQPVDRITVVDSESGTQRTVSTASDRIQSRGAVVQDGIVYWIDGAYPDDPDGSVVRYDIAAQERSLADSTAATEIDRDVRGVGWPGGLVPAAGAPDNLPAFFTTDGQYQPVYSDGTNTAWQLGNSDVFTWTDEQGSTVSWRVDVGSVPETSADLIGLAGPILFYAVSDTGTGTFALDTRSGAVAHLGDDLIVAYPAFGTDGTVRLVHLDGLAVTRLDPATLSELRCGQSR